MNKIDAQHVNFFYGDFQALKDISMAIEEKAVVAFIGPSGCGKSTVLKLLTGILSPDRGRILVDGEEIRGLSSHFAYMPQNDLLFPWKTILDNVCLYGRIHGSVEEMREQAREYFPVFGLEGYEDSYPASLSGGMRQRAAFLRTALCSADILLLDEPFGALDVITRGEMQDWLLAMRKELGKTVVLVTHDMDEAIYLSDRILILNPAPAGIHGEISVCETQRDRDWLYGQGELRRKIHGRIMGKERKGNDAL